MSVGLPNLITVVLDCVRAKSLRVGEGRNQASTPNLDALAKKGTVFRRAVAPANWTVPSHWSMMTGAYPATHGMRQAGRVPTGLTPIARTLRGLGYETALFTEQEFLVAGIGIEAGYELRLGPVFGSGAVTEERSPARSVIRRTSGFYSGRALKVLGALPPLMVPLSMLDYRIQTGYKRRICGDETILRFRDWIRARETSRPFHAFVNFVDAHEPYFSSDGVRPSGFLARWYSRTPRNFLLLLPQLRERVPWGAVEQEYLRSVESADRKLGLLIRVLEENGALERSAIVVTADHGQALGEAGTVYHGNGATEAVTRVPLVFVPPGGMSLPHEVGDWTTLCDLPRWMEALAHGSAPFDREGRPSTDARAPLPPEKIVYCEGNPASDFGHQLRGRAPAELWNHRLLAAYREDTKWVLDQDSGTMYRWSIEDWPDDAVPDETLTTTAARAVRDEIFRPYESLQARTQGQSRARVEMPIGVADRLRSWGYDS